MDHWRIHRNWRFRWNLFRYLFSLNFLFPPTPWFFVNLKFNFLAAAQYSGKTPKDYPSVIKIVSSLQLINLCRRFLSKNKNHRNLAFAGTPWKWPSLRRNAFLHAKCQTWRQWVSKRRITKLNNFQNSAAKWINSSPSRGLEEEKEITTLRHAKIYRVRQPRMSRH